MSLRPRRDAELHAVLSLRSRTALIQRPSHRGLRVQAVDVGSEVRYSVRLLSSASGRPAPWAPANSAWSASLLVSAGRPSRAGGRGLSNSTFVR